MALTASVVGASGYSGAELLRLLSGHPAVGLVAAGAHTRAGEALEAVLPHLTGGGELCSIDEALAAPADVCFSCLPGGQLGERLPAAAAPVVVDLSDDHRGSPGWVYGLTEFARDLLAGATRIANPGCYPTATLLCLIPFAQNGLIEGPVVVDALSGVSGAGRRAEDRLLHAAVSGSASAYGTVPHRHVAEMERGLADIAGLQTTISFTPHLVPMARGVLATARARLREPLSDDAARAVLGSAYSGERFVRVTDGWPATKFVAGSNAAIVSARVDQRAGWLVASAAIDNLCKGAAGQALQNANLALGLEEGLGLSNVGVWP